MAWESSPVGRIGMVGTRRASSGANSAIIRDHRSSPRELRAHFNTFESFSSARALVLQSSSITKVQYPGKSQNRGMTYAKVYPETVAGTNIVERKTLSTAIYNSFPNYHSTAQWRSSETFANDNLIVDHHHLGGSLPSRTCKQIYQRLVGVGSRTKC